MTTSPISPAGHAVADTQSTSAREGHLSPTDSPMGQLLRDPQTGSAHGGTDSTIGRSPSDARVTRADGGSLSLAGQLTPDAHMSAAREGHQTPPQASRRSVPVPQMPVVDPLLFVHVTAHRDLEDIRKASGNRLAALTRTEPDEDGVVRGFGLSDSHPDVARLTAICDALVALEHGAELNLKRALRKCSIHPWVKAQVGLGEKQVARLLGAIGDPYWHLAEDRPRTVSELWAYSGLHVLPASHSGSDTHTARADGANTSDPGHDPIDTHGRPAGVAARRRKGQQANWSTDAKTRAYLCATSCLRQERSPYRAEYLARREHTAETHPEWTPGHSHADGLRIVSKAILRDLWREAKRLHEEA